MNILLNLYNFDEPWAKEKLKNILKADSRVLVIPFSFSDEKMQGNDDWVKHYGKREGIWYEQIIRPFQAYGIKEDQIEWLDYYLDTAETGKRKIHQSDIIFFTGGIPDKIVERLEEAGLMQAIQQFHGIVMGSGAGAMVQFREYHITRDEHYHVYGYGHGLDFIRDFEIEVHYTDSYEQRESIRFYKRERGKKLYAMEDEGGIIVEDNGHLTFMGKVVEL